MYDLAAAGTDRTPFEPRCGPLLWTSAVFRKGAGWKSLICAEKLESGWGTRSPRQTRHFLAIVGFVRRAPALCPSHQFKVLLVGAPRALGRSVKMSCRLRIITVV